MFLMHVTWLLHQSLSTELTDIDPNSQPAGRPAKASPSPSVHSSTACVLLGGKQRQREALPDASEVRRSSKSKSHADGGGYGMPVAMAALLVRRVSWA